MASVWPVSCSDCARETGWRSVNAVTQKPRDGVVVSDAGQLPRTGEYVPERTVSDFAGASPLYTAKALSSRVQANCATTTATTIR